MSLIRYEPWNRLNQFQKEINKLFDSRLGNLVNDDETQIATSDWTPAVDIKEDQNQFTILVDVPGIEAKDIEVTMEKGVLSIKGERSSEAKEEREGYKRIERSRGTFYRSFTLPDTADAEKINARGKNGVLEITIPKQERAQPRRISVNVEEAN